MVLKVSSLVFLLSLTVAITANFALAAHTKSELETWKGCCEECGGNFSQGTGRDGLLSCSSIQSCTWQEFDHCVDPPTSQTAIRSEADPILSKN